MAELSRLPLARADRAVANPQTSAQTLILVIEPLFAINWAGEVLAIVGAENANPPPPVEGPRLVKERYAKIRARLADSLIHPDTITPWEWGIWAGIIKRYNLFETSDLGNGTW